MVDQNNEDSGNATDSETEKSMEQKSETGEQETTSSKNEIKEKSNIRLYIEIGVIVVGIILIAVASIQVKGIINTKFNVYSEIALTLSIIFIASPAVLYFKKLREMKPAIVVIAIMLVGILILYILLVPYKLVTVHFGLLGDVMVEYIIGVFLLIFMVSHMTKVHLLKNSKS
jgi:hypothetical protein